MKYFLKFLLFSAIISVVIGISEKWYTMFYLGRYWEHASILATSLVGFIVPLAIIYMTILAIQKVINLKINN